MIERAVFSYFNPEESFKNKAGFKYYSDFLYTMSLATELAGRHFKEVHLVTSAWGEKVLKTAGIKATEYSTELEEMKHISKWFWAYGKLIAYNTQTKPFVHIDNDVFLWKPLQNRVLSARLCFQSKEQMNIPNYKWYDVLRPCWNKALVRPEVVVQNEITDFVYNCGICGGHDLGFFKDWIKCSTEYLLAPENHELFTGEFREILQHQNLFHEQYFAASLIKAKGLRQEVEVIADKVEDLVKASNNGYTHLWGVTKTEQETMLKVRKRLQKEFPAVFNKVTDFVNNYLINECRREEEIVVR
jgi:hypothetical protein